MRHGKCCIAGQKLYPVEATPGDIANVVMDNNAPINPLLVRSREEMNR